MHIPRTAGNAITRTLAEHLLWKDDVILATHTGAHINRHSRLSIICNKLHRRPKHVVAVHRDQDEIFESSWRLFKIHPRVPRPVNVFERCVNAAHEGLQSFIDTKWKPQLLGKSVWDWFIDDGGPVTRVEYNQLHEQWPEICRLAGLCVVPELKRIDWQTEDFHRRMEHLLDDNRDAVRNQREQATAK